MGYIITKEDLFLRSWLSRSPVIELLATVGGVGRGEMRVGSPLEIPLEMPLWTP